MRCTDHQHVGAGQHLLERQHVRPPDVLVGAEHLSRLELVDAYEKASVGQRLGRPIACGLSIPEAAANPEGARRLLSALLSEAGTKALLRAGFRPVDPPVSGQWERLPEPARSLVKRRPTP